LLHNIKKKARRKMNALHLQRCGRRRRRRRSKPVEMGDAALSRSLPSIHLATILHHNPLYTIVKKFPVLRISFWFA
jgi:hypothetical protein